MYVSAWAVWLSQFVSSVLLRLASSVQHGSGHGAYLSPLQKFQKKKKQGSRRACEMSWGMDMDTDAYSIFLIPDARAEARRETWNIPGEDCASSEKLDRGCWIVREREVYFR